MSLSKHPEHPLSPEEDESEGNDEMAFSTNYSSNVSPSSAFYWQQQFHLLMKKVWDGCNSLRGSPNELWKAYTLK